jgi:hypothetical protein
MFKKILQSLSKSQSAKTGALAGPPDSPPPAKTTGVLDRIMRGTPPTASLLAAQAAAQAAQTAQAAQNQAAQSTPEQLCEISPKMAKDQIYARLKLLYRRYNHSASSLDSKTRSEAEKMLNAIVLVREKHFGQI